MKIISGKNCDRILVIAVFASLLCGCQSHFMSNAQVDIKKCQIYIDIMMCDLEKGRLWIECKPSNKDTADPRLIHEKLRVLEYEKNIDDPQELLARARAGDRSRSVQTRILHKRA